MRRRVFSRVALALDIRMGLLRVLPEENRFFSARSTFELVLNLLEMVS